MISIPVAVLALLSTTAGTQFKVMPAGVILSGVGDTGSYSPLFLAAEKVHSLRHFEKFSDDLLCSKLAESSFVFIKKTFPRYTGLRFRKHIQELLLKTGLGKPFQYQELATPEFEKFAASLLKNNPNIVPGPTTRLAFLTMLQSSVVVQGNPLNFRFGPSLSLATGTREALLESQATLLTNQSEIVARMKSMPSDPGAQYKLWTQTSAQQEMNLTRDALEAFRIYYDNEVASLDVGIDNILSDPIWKATKLRRKVKNMRELKQMVPLDFDTIVGLHKEFSDNAGRVPSSEEMAALEEANINSQYSLKIAGYAGGKSFVITLEL